MATEYVTCYKFLEINRKERKCKICPQLRSVIHDRSNCNEGSMRTRSKRIKLSCDDDEEDNDFGFSKEAISRYEKEMNKVDEYGRSLIHTAVAQTDVRLVKLLLSRGVDPLLETAYEKASLLWFAIQTGCVHVAQVLIDHGNDLKKLEFNVLYYASAVRSKDFNMARLLLRNGIDINEPLRSSSALLLLEAIDNDDAAIVEFLLANGAFVDEIRDSLASRNETLLFTAVRYNKYKIVTLLVKYGANVHHKNKDSESIVHTAVNFMQPKILQYLVKNGADVNAVTKYNSTPLHYSAKYECTKSCRFGSLGIIRFWQYEYFEIESKTSIHDRYCIDDLIKCGAKINAKNKKGRTPLHVAAKCGCIYKVQQLLDAGADLDVADKRGCTPLSIAVRHHNRHVIRQLLIAGADPKLIFNEEIYFALRPIVTKAIAKFLIAKRAAGFDVDDRLLAKIEMDDKLISYQEKCIKEVAYMEKVVLENKELTLLSFLRANSRRSAFYGFKETEFINFITEEHYEELPIYQDMLEQKFVTVTKILPLRENAIDSLNVFLRQGLPTEVLEKIIDKLDVDNLRKIIEASDG